MKNEHFTVLHPQNIGELTPKNGKIAEIQGSRYLSRIQCELILENQKPKWPDHLVW